MKVSSSLVKRTGAALVVCAGIFGTTYATSLVVPQITICATIAQDNTKLLKSISITPYYENKPLDTTIWSSGQDGKCIKLSRDWLIGAAPRGTSFYVKGVDASGTTHLLEMRDIAMFSGIQTTNNIILNYHIDNISTTSVPVLIGTVYNAFFVSDNGKISTIVSKGDTYRSDMDEVYALDTMRQIGATKYTLLTDFKGKDTITREQAAKFFVAAWMALNPGKSIPPAGTAGCRFTDAYTMDRTLINSVNYACQLGLMKGSAGAFNPRNTLTLAEAVTILIRMQHGKMDESNKIWYRRYFDKAYEVSLFAHYAYNPHINEGTNAISREMIAFLIRRLLEINNITPKYYNTI